MNLQELEQDLAALGVTVATATDQELVDAHPQLVAMTRTQAVDYFATYRTLGDALTSVEAAEALNGEKSIEEAMADVDEILAAIVALMAPTIYDSMLRQYGQADGSAGGVPVSNAGFRVKLLAAQSAIPKLADEHIAAIMAYGSRQVRKYPGLLPGHLIKYVRQIREAA